MKQVSLRTNPQDRVVRRQCARLRLFERNRVHPHGSQACHQKCRAEPLAIDLAIYLFGRLFYPKLFEQSRQFFVTNATTQHFELYQLLRGLLPRLIRLGTLIWQSVHHLLTNFPSQSPASIRRSCKPILGRIRLTPNRQHYTSSESSFCEDVLLRTHPADRVDTQSLVPGGAR